MMQTTNMKFMTDDNSVVQTTPFITPISSSGFLVGMQTSASFVKVAGALIRAQAKMGDATKGAKNPFFKSSYADLNAVREAVMPVLHEEKVGVFQPTVVLNGKQYVRTLLLHESGEFLASDTEVLCSKQNDPQALGSAISYARRYGLQAFMNVGAVDDDGEKAMSRPMIDAPVGSKQENKKPSTFRKTAPPVETPKEESSSADGWEN